jgi:hypothetical protein
MSVAAIYTSTISKGIIPVVKNTSAVDIFNDEDFSNSFNIRIRGLYSLGEKPDTSYIMPLEEFRDSYNFIETNLLESKHKESILSIANAYPLLYEVFGIKVESEKDKFISDYFLREAVNTAHKLIANIFENAEIKTELYVDHEEPQYKFLSISIVYTNVSASRVNNLLDKFDKLQEQFLNKVENKHASKITFHLDIK